MEIKKFEIKLVSFADARSYSSTFVVSTSSIRDAKREAVGQWLKSQRGELINVKAKLVK